MTATTARVSVGIPVYNGENYLGEALRSVQEQDLEDIEIVISDNGSTDGTAELCRAAAKDDSRIVYVRSTVNRGGAWNYNRVAELATGALFTWVAADDIIRPAFVRRCVEVLDAAGPNAVLSFPRTQLIDGAGRVFEDLNDADLAITQPSAHQRVARVLSAQASHIIYGVIRTDVLRRTRGIRSVVGDDMVLLTELACRGTFVLVPEQLFLQRRHDAQYSAQGHDQFRWYSPQGRARFAFPQTRLNVELLAAAWSAPLPTTERARTAAVVLPSWTLPRWRGIAGDLRHAIGLPRLRRHTSRS